MQSLEAFVLGSTIPVTFNTQGLDQAPITFAGTPRLRVVLASDFSVILADIVPTVDAGGVTGRHRASIAATTPNGFVVDGEYIIEVQAGTVDGVSVVGKGIARFSLNSGSLPANSVNANALAADAVTEIQNGLATAAGVTSATAPLATQTSVNDIPTNAEFAAGIAPLATAAGLSAAVAPLATAAGVTAATAPLATQTSVNDIPTNAEFAAAVALLATAAALDDVPNNAEFSAAIGTVLSAVGAVPDGVWDEALAGHTTPGSTGAQLAAAASAGDPWASTTFGAAGAGSAGAKMAALGTPVENADALLGRSQQGGSNSGLTVADALAGGLCNFTISNGTLTVRNADGTTAYSRTLTRAELDAIISATVPL